MILPALYPGIKQRHQCTGDWMPGSGGRRLAGDGVMVHDLPLLHEGVISYTDAPSRQSQGQTRGEGTLMKFGVMCFSTNSNVEAPHSLLLEVARFADHHGFTCIWTPEWYFSPFGGLFPNPCRNSSPFGSPPRARWIPPLCRGLGCQRPAPYDDAGHLHP
jgi:hypothetical protein